MEKIKKRAENLLRPDWNSAKLKNKLDLWGSSRQVSIPGMISELARASSQVLVQGPDPDPGPDP
jgi:hypothetical protein